MCELPVQLAITLLDIPGLLKLSGYVFNSQLLEGDREKAALPWVIHSVEYARESPAFSAGIIPKFTMQSKWPRF